MVISGQSDIRIVNLTYSLEKYVSEFMRGLSLTSPYVSYMVASIMDIPPDFTVIGPIGIFPGGFLIGNGGNVVFDGGMNIGGSYPRPRACGFLGDYQTVTVTGGVSLSTIYSGCFLPDVLNVHGSFKVRRCPGRIILPKTSLYVREDMNLNKDAGISLELPMTVIVDGGVSLSSYLPWDLGNRTIVIGGSLTVDVRNDTTWDGIPSKMTIGKDLVFLLKDSLDMDQEELVKRLMPPNSTVHGDVLTRYVYNH